MTNNKLFPDLIKVLRNCITVGIVAGLANFQNIYPPSLEMIYSVAVGFGIAFAVEFVHAYRLIPKPNGHRQNMSTFFLS
jgi:hypothetical protein